MTDAEAMLQVAAADLDAVGARWALIGGMAVTFRVAPRFTNDLDFAVTVAGDTEADSIVFNLRSRGYHSGKLINQDYVERVSGVRLNSTRQRSGVIIDLLFASSGIEPEIVAAAERIEVLPQVRVPLATIGHLIALKVLAGRHQDLMDLENLIPAASTANLEQARSAVRLIRSRGFHREKDLAAELERFIREAGR